MHRRSRRPLRLPAALAALLAALALLVGCEERRQDAPAADRPAATLVATAGYGARELLSTRVEPDQSVMRATRGATDVRTAYAGAYIRSMLGLESDQAGTRDWFFSVNGLVAAVGAKDVTLHDGDVAWWDHRDWGDLQQAPAMVGTWPAPWALPGGRGPQVSADPPLDATLREAGARLVEGGDPSFRVRVGASDDIARRDPVWREALADPDRAGLTVTIADGAVLALGPDGPRTPVPEARALIAAVPTGPVPADGALLVVAGLDADAARAAAEALARDPAMVRLTYAVALDGEGNVLRAGGRAP